MIESSLNEAIRHLIATLQIPDWTEYRETLSLSAHHSFHALIHTSTLIYWTFRPLLLSVAYIIYHLSAFLYQHVFLQGIYQHGFAQTKHVIIWIVRFHQDLTREELLGEGIAMLSLILMYQTWKYIKRQSYMTRFALWQDRQCKQIVKTYRAQLHKIATISKVLAAMTPHGLFLCGAVFVKLLIPGVVTYIVAETDLVTALWHIWPMFSTIHIVYERQTKPIEEIPRRKSRQPLTPQTNLRVTRSHATFFSPRKTTPVTCSLEEEETYWMQFWTVYAFWQAVKRLASLNFVISAASSRFSWLPLLGAHIDAVLIVWIYLVPLMAPTGSDIPDARPLVLLTRYLTPIATRWYEGCSELVSFETWQVYVVEPLTNLFRALAFVKLLSTPTVEELTHLLQDGRSLLLPSVTLLMPGFITSYGIVYVQYLWPLAKTTQNDTKQLQYWVLHIFWATLLQIFAGVWYWIPLANHFIFLSWCWMGLPRTIANGYRMLQDDLIAFGLLHGEISNKSWDQTYTSRAWRYILSRLPRAEDDTERDSNIQNNKGAIEETSPIATSSS